MRLIIIKIVELLLFFNAQLKSKNYCTTIQIKFLSEITANKVNFN